MDPLAIVALGFAGVLLIGALWVLGTYNGLVRLRNAVDESWSSIDAELQRRYDLVPNLVETVRAYAAHERDVFERVTQARARAAANHGEPESQARDENAFVGSLRSLFVVAEAYPDLRADTHFRSLMQELSLTEDRIARARRFYNANVRDLNIRVESFPSSMVARSGGFERRQHFEIEDHVRTAPVVAL